MGSSALFYSRSLCPIRRVGASGRSGHAPILSVRSGESRLHEFLCRRSRLKKAPFDQKGFRTRGWRFHQNLACAAAMELSSTPTTCPWERSGPMAPVATIDLPRRTGRSAPSLSVRLRCWQAKGPTIRRRRSSRRRRAARTPILEARSCHRHRSRLSAPP